MAAVDSLVYYQRLATPLDLRQESCRMLRLYIHLCHNGTLTNEEMTIPGRRWNGTLNVKLSVVVLELT